MSKQPTFDPKKPFTKVRGMGHIHYEQDGYKFNSGHQYLGSTGTKKPAPAPKPEKKGSARERAQAKIAQKKGDDPLDGFRADESPEALSSVVKENEAARQAEEHV